MSDDEPRPVDALIGRLRTLVAGATFEPGVTVDQPTLFVPADRLLETCQILSTDPAFGFTLLVDIIGVDYWPREPRYELVYHVVSIHRRQRLRVKVRLPGTDPHVTTVSGIWPGAGFLEREVWDLLGIVFDGHGDLRRLLMPEDWQGHPLRKDYPVQVKLPATSGEPLQMTEQQFKANIEADRARRK